jgi:hypothetical protein
MLLSVFGLIPPSYLGIGELKQTGVYREALEGGRTEGHGLKKGDRGLCGN